MAEDRDRKRELILAPGEYAYMQDGTKGLVKTHVGPTVINQTNQDQPVVYNEVSHRFVPVTLEDSKRQQVVAPVGFYVVLTNPCIDRDGKLYFPEAGRSQDTPESMRIGHKVNIPGPINFALWPGQTAEVLRGHHLGLNEYLVCKVYDEAEAKKNWPKVILKAADTGEAPPAETEKKTSQDMPELVMGKLFNILGINASFFIPPTGVSVVPAVVDEGGNAVYIRQAETLEQLEYAILVDEDGNKEFPRGPSVVFPKPTQDFLKDPENPNIRKFKAIEMNELQGIQLKFTKEVELVFADGSKHKYPAGEEIFITGKEMPLYYQDEGHQVVKYDGKTLHYAVAIPEGEARYVMERKTGKIRTVTGPNMLLPNPVKEIIVRRALSDFESVTWFPGTDGTGSKEALDYNRMLRAQAGREPTTRQGVVSENMLNKSMTLGMDMGMDKGDMTYSSNEATRGIAPSRARLTAKSSMLMESRQGKGQEVVAGDSAERKSTYNEPRTLVFASKYKGVPTIRINRGSAIELVNVDGSREVVVGPKTVLLDYGQTLGILKLSTGKPKNTNALLPTAYLKTSNNKVADIITVETSDHVTVAMKLSYMVNFEGDSQKWFSLENYVKHMTDHLRSVLKGKIRQFQLAAFYDNNTDIIRNIVLGENKDGKRPGMMFEENGMHVVDVEVLEVGINDPNIASLLVQTQRDVVSQNIKVQQEKKKYEVTTELEAIKRNTLEETTKTVIHSKDMDKERLAAQQVLDILIREASIEVLAKQKEVTVSEVAVEKIRKDAEIEGLKARAMVILETDARRQALDLDRLTAEVEAVKDQMGAVQPGLIEALQATSSRELLAKMAANLSFKTILGEDNVVGALKSTFENTPVMGLMAGLLQKAGGGDKKTE